MKKLLLIISLSLLLVGCDFKTMDERHWDKTQEISEELDSQGSSVDRILKYVSAEFRIERADFDDYWLLHDCSGMEIQYSTFYETACDCKTNQCYSVVPYPPIPND